MPAEITIRPYEGEAEARAAATLMASTDPWRALGRTSEHTYRNVTNPQSEAYVALETGQVVGVIVLAINIPLVKGYICGLAVKAECRGRGIGRQLLTFAEDRIARFSPNVFLTVSSFNTGAQRFYERAGYERIGELKEFLIPGASEWLMRKTTGPWAAFQPRAQ